MALPETGVIEIRSTATANNVNGGGFNAARGGTDYTLQDAAQLTNVDGTSTASTTFTSALATFTAVMVGNYLHITAGTGATVGWYEIVTYVNANTVTLDRVSGTYTAATFYIGGAMSLNSTLDDDLFEIGVAGNIFYVKGSTTYTLGEAVSITAAGSSTLPIIIQGYITTRGDNPTGNTRPILATGANGLALGGYWDIKNCIVTGTANTVLTDAAMTTSEAHFCKVVNNSTATSRTAISITNQIACEAISYRGIGATGQNVLGGWYHHSRYGYSYGSTFKGLAHSIISSNSIGAITASATAVGMINSNTLYGGEVPVGIGYGPSGATINIIFTNNIVYGFVTGVSHTTANQRNSYDNWNNYYNNTTDVTNWPKGANDIAVNPSFVSVTEVAGTTGAFVAGDSKLVDTSKNFTTLGVVAGDYVMIKSGTGVTAGCAQISSISTTTNPNDTLSTDITVGTSTVTDKVYAITLGNNFLPTGAV